jgi:hypothetical protein
MPVLLLRCSLPLIMPVCGAAATAWIGRLNAVFADAHSCRNVAVLKLHFEFNAREPILGVNGRSHLGGLNKKTVGNASAGARHCITAGVCLVRVHQELLLNLLAQIDAKLQL